MKRHLCTVAAALFLVGCGTSRPAPPPPAEEPPRATIPAPPAQPEPGQPKPDTPPPVQPPEPGPTSRLPLRKVGTHYEVAELKPGTTYLWAPDGERIAFETPEALWSVAPDGSEGDRFPTEGSFTRSLVGWHDGSLIFLEQRRDQIAVLSGRPDEPPRLVAALNFPGADQPGYQLWHHLSGSQLVVASETAKAHRVDLTTGETTPLLRLPVRHGQLAVSPDGRYLAFKTDNRGDATKVLDLQTGALAQQGEEFHLVGLEWAPGGDRWAVRAAEPGSGLPVALGANYADGATHVDIGDRSGSVQHLIPPSKLQLVGGPFWSPDGRRLAVTAGVARPPAPGRPAEFRTTDIWLVTPATNEWQHLRHLDAGSIDGWTPDGSSLLVTTADSLVRFPVDGSAPTVLPPMMGRAWLSDGELLYISTDSTPKLMLKRGAQTPLALETVPSWLDYLSVKGGFAAVVTTPLNGGLQGLSLYPLN